MRQEQAAFGSVRRRVTRHDRRGEVAPPRFRQSRGVLHTVFCGNESSRGTFMVYSWPSIVRGSLMHDSARHAARHFFYAAGWKKFERLWDGVIRARQLPLMTPLLEAVLSRVSRVERRWPQKNPTFNAERAEIAENS